MPKERDAIDAVFHANVDDIPDDESMTRGLAMGEDITVKVALWRADDQADKSISYAPPPSGPGAYVPTSSSPVVAPQMGASLYS